MDSRKLYKISFLSLGKCYELYAEHVASSPMWGFTEVAGLVFDPPAPGRVIDPTEERLREEFKDTRVLHLPMQAVVRIEEVERKGAMHIRDAMGGEKITPFPMPPRSR
ncbi:MAG: DUF1820 family protein [Fulvimonas sp.]|jgi:hypothetical protein|nr:DUF1820 family protein [Fulvimonas sp.]